MAEESTTITMTEQSARPSIPSAERIELFVRLIGQHQYQIHRYLLSLVPNTHDADDLFQQTNLFLWREFNRFEEGTSFVSWACSVAYHEVLAWRKSKLRERLVFSPEFLQAVSLQWDLAAERIEQRSQALVHCVSKLPQHHKELIQRRYGEHHRIETIAESLQRTPDAIYRMLSRIRHALHACVEQTLELQAK